MRSITYGNINFDKMFEVILNYINQDPEYDYQISIGTDSQNFDSTKIVMVIAILRVGSGGIFFYDIQHVKKITNIKQKIFLETQLSIELATKLVSKFEEKGINHKIEIHVDAGKNGPSSKIIPQIKAWVNSCGFDCKVKPDSYAASSIANKYSK